MKNCDCCLEQYEADKKYSLKNLCSECYEKDKKARNHQLRCMRKGITVGFFEKQLERQNYLCGCCSIKFKDWNEILIEHCHVTGEFRSLACKKCNNILGYYKENTHLMKERIHSLTTAIHYLERFKNKDL